MQFTPSFAGGTPPLAAGVLGVLPAGAIMGALHVVNAIAFNSTTNSLIIGTTPGGNQLLAATDLKATGRTDTPVPIASAGPLGVDTPIYYTYTQTGPAPTAGGLVVWLDYLPGPG